MTALAMAALCAAAPWADTIRIGGVKHDGVYVHDAGAYYLVLFPGERPSALVNKADIGAGDIEIDTDAARRDALRTAWRAKQEAVKRTRRTRVIARPAPVEPLASQGRDSAAARQALARARAAQAAAKYQARLRMLNEQKERAAERAQLQAQQRALEAQRIALNRENQRLYNERRRLAYENYRQQIYTPYYSYTYANPYGHFSNYRAYTFGGHYLLNTYVTLGGAQHFVHFSPGHTTSVRVTGVTREHIRHGAGNHGDRRASPPAQRGPPAQIEIRPPRFTNRPRTDNSA